MVNLKIVLPYSRWEYKICGVYRIQFDTGEFYIGASSDLRSRASSWLSICETPAKLSERDYSKYGVNIMSRVKAGGDAILSIVELCSKEDLTDREAEYLDKFKDDPQMVSKSDCSWKVVLQYKRDGLFIKRHISIRAAARYNKTTTWRVQEVLDGNRKAHKDMIFIYESDYNNRRREIIKDRSPFRLPKKNKNIKVIQHDTAGNVVAMHDTYAAAGKIVGCDPNNIKRAIAGKQQTAGGFKWGLISEPPGRPVSH